MAQWAGGASEKSDKKYLSIDSDSITFPLGNYMISAWINYRDKGDFIYPGTWSEQPLGYLTKLRAVGLVADAFGKMANDKNWSKKITDVQRELIGELNG